MKFKNLVFAFIWIFTIYGVPLKNSEMEEFGNILEKIGSALNLVMTPKVGDNEDSIMDMALNILSALQSSTPTAMTIPFPSSTASITTTTLPYDFLPYEIPMDLIIPVGFETPILKKN